MKKVSIIVLVIILVGTLSMVSYGIEDTCQVEVNFTVNHTIGLKVIEGGSVDFGVGLNPIEKYYKIKATTLEVISTKNNWTVTHNIEGTAPNPSEVLSVRYGNYGNWRQNSETYSGNSGIEQFAVSYKLYNLIGNLTQRNNHFIVTFTVTA